MPGPAAAYGPQAGDSASFPCPSFQLLVLAVEPWNKAMDAITGENIISLMPGYPTIGPH